MSALTTQSGSARKRWNDHLVYLYGPERASAVFARIEALVERYRESGSATTERPALTSRITEADALLITYGDQIREPEKPPLRTLAEVLNRHLAGVISGVHILPFYPYTSDDGFSVVDYRAVDPALGDWNDVALVGRKFRMMYDLVINHISASSRWFQGFLRDESPYDRYFIVMDPKTDLTEVVRPRALPLLTAFQTPSGPKHVWTTFSEDQIDIDFSNPEVLVEMLDVLLGYAAHGAELIRLDAIAYLWKKVGTRCVHLEETHRVVQLMRSVLDVVAPNVLFITETNVPHRDNISYFGDGYNEAQLVYQFPLAPLVVHSFATGDATRLTRWAADLEPTGPDTTFFNFLASHDGIGVMPAKGILTDDEITALADRAVAHGGHVSMKNNADGSQSPYELNITFFDAISNPNAAESEERAIDRFVVSQAIMLSLAGLPGIYVHSLFGSHNDHDNVKATGRYRSINRTKWSRAHFERDLEDPNSHPSKVFRRYKELLAARAAESAFHPASLQRIIEGPGSLFVVARGAESNVVCLHNVSDREAFIDIDVLGSSWREGSLMVDLLSNERDTASRTLKVAPFSSRWWKRV